jgi:hypothetical protein
MTTPRSRFVYFVFEFCKIYRRLTSRVTEGGLGHALAINRDTAGGPGCATAVRRYHRHVPANVCTGGSLFPSSAVWSLYKYLSIFIFFSSSNPNISYPVVASQSFPVFLGSVVSFLRKNVITFTISLTRSLI